MSRNILNVIRDQLSMLTYFECDYPKNNTLQVIFKGKKYKIRVDKNG